MDKISNLLGPVSDSMPLCLGTVPGSVRSPA